ncbi:hypothetical protein OGAPHI_002722 [Ogataea philodendri]|uniref:Uncharacterized protein n=1 Tax=Ogataea philodendri TaxID=1378263 RepID=A0A9P8PCW3_9ASCO|nr:uncharacterized protein OGAPHI_002722 [Ogataea philodendri]KAH3668967.1 hypothetical protein OGAPHI_002722 [Ogataea philodendri]
MLFRVEPSMESSSQWAFVSSAVGVMTCSKFWYSSTLLSNSSLSSPSSLANISRVSSTLDPKFKWSEDVKTMDISIFTMDKLRTMFLIDTSECGDGVSWFTTITILDGLWPKSSELMVLS